MVRKQWVKYVLLQALRLLGRLEMKMKLLNSSCKRVSANSQSQAMGKPCGEKRYVSNIPRQIRDYCAHSDRTVHHQIEMLEHASEHPKLFDGRFGRWRHTIQVKIEYKFTSSMHRFHGFGFLFIIRSFFVGDNGVYEGTGWHVRGAHTYNYNSNGTGISFIGDFSGENSCGHTDRMWRLNLSCFLFSWELQKSCQVKRPSIRRKNCSNVVWKWANWIRTTFCSAHAKLLPSKVLALSCTASFRIGITGRRSLHSRNIAAETRITKPQPIIVNWIKYDFIKRFPLKFA